MTDSADRRRFWRAGFHSDALLHHRSGDIPVEVVDISLNGVLLGVPERWSGELGEPCNLELRLSDDDAIVMSTVVAHIEGRSVGLRCAAIDLDSITHLRRLVELNAGDPALLDRELAALLN